MKKAVSLILIIALCLSISSCKTISKFFNKEEKIHSAYDYENHKLASAADKMTLSYKDYRQEGYQEFLDKLESFAAKLSYEVYSDKGGSENYVISPISVYMALALATECADGETRDEILRAVGVSYDEVKSFTKYLYAYSNQAYYSNGNEDQVAFIKQLTNSIWADNDIKLKEAGVNNLANNYNCDLFTVDFGSDEGEKAINAYIEEKTHGLIDGNVDLSPETLFVLMNTFYLKEIWNSYGRDLPFTDKSYLFTNSDGSSVDTKLLRGYYNSGRAYEGNGYTSFYTETEHGLKIKFIVPTDGHTVDEVFTAENIYNINNITNYGHVDNENRLLHHTRVLFPEYKASFDGDITDTLRDDFNIHSMFKMGECDFSNVTDERLACEGVIHKCELNVNKKGIEGAAVTYIPNATSAGPGEYENVYHDYVVDRAFGFVITDYYGTVLFCGVVNNI